MADGNYDPCICSTEWAMQRLLSILRTSQQQCNDNECLQAPGTETNPAQDWNMFFVGFLWLMVVALLFATRPSTLRGQPQNKPNNDSNGNPPPPDVPPVQ